MYFELGFSNATSVTQKVYYAHMGLDHSTCLQQFAPSHGLHHGSQQLLLLRCDLML